MTALIQSSGVLNPTRLPLPRRPEFFASHLLLFRKKYRRLISEEGQMTLKCFIAEWISSAPNLENRLRVFEWFAKFVEEVQWMEPRTLYTINSVLSNLPFSVKQPPTFFTKEIGSPLSHSCQRLRDPDETASELAGFGSGIDSRPFQILPPENHECLPGHCS